MKISRATPVLFVERVEPTRDSTKFWKWVIASEISEMSLDAVNFDIHSDFEERMPSTPSRSV